VNKSMFIITGKGDYDLLVSYPEDSFDEYELYLKTIDDCNLDKITSLPEHIKLTSIHQPTYIKLNGSLIKFDLTGADEIGKQSMEDLKVTLDFAQKCKIPKVVLHDCTFNVNINDQQKKLSCLGLILNKIKSPQVCVETNVLWYTFYYPKRALLTKHSDFEKLRNLVSDLHLTLDIEHISMTSALTEFLKHNKNYKIEEVSREKFEEDFFAFAKVNSEKIESAFKKTLSLFVSEFAHNITHIHICGSDYMALSKCDKYSDLLGEHLPIKYKSEHVRDRFDYNFIFNILKQLSAKQINIVLEIGVKKDMYDFHTEMLSSCKHLKQMLLNIS